jgi:hypothetical protein
MSFETFNKNANKAGDNRYYLRHLAINSLVCYSFLFLSSLFLQLRIAFRGIFLKRIAFGDEKAKSVHYSTSIIFFISIILLLIYIRMCN